MSVAHPGAVTATRPGTGSWDWLESLRLGLLAALVLGLALSISLSQITLVALAAWLLLARAMGRPVTLRAPLLGPIAAFAAASVLAALASGHRVESLVACKGLLDLLALFVIASALPDAATARRFATWLILALALSAIAGIVQVVACPGPDAIAHGPTLAEKFLRKCTRARGFYSIYMTLAGILALAMTAALPRLARLEREGWWLAPAWLLSGVGLALTYVRGAWLGFVAGALAVLIGLGRRGLFAAAALLLIGTATVALLPGVGARVRTIGSSTDDTTRDRLAMIEAGRRLVLRHPVLGIGPGQVKRIYPSVATAEAMRHSTSHLHNTPLQITVERGLVGLATWLWIFVAGLVRGTVVMRRLPAHDRAIALGVLAAIVTFLVGGLFEYNFGDTEVLLVMLALMALPFALAPATAAPA
jgi:O-antigen ligase